MLQEQIDSLLIKIRGLKRAAFEPTAERIEQLQLRLHRGRRVALVCQQRCKLFEMGCQWVNI